MNTALKPTYALVEYGKDGARASLLEWKGEYRQFETVSY